tara:strand:- start:298 stop:912 length:615 start_codon:yes stop_codon:yes gene_type:complete
MFNKLAQEHPLAKENDLYNYHSGGGCFHLAFDSDVETIQWLINAIYNNDDGEPSMDLEDITINSRCMFGIDLNYLEDDDLYDSIVKILKKHNLNHFNDCYDNAWFLDSFESGVEKMKTITNEINLLTKEKEFLVVWNKDSYGDVKPKEVSLGEFKADGVGGDWNIDKDGEFTIDHLENLELGDTLKVCSPFGWDIKVIKIKEVS